MAFVLTPEPPVPEWLAEFDVWAERSQGFFAGKPVVLDASKLELDREALVEFCASWESKASIRNGSGPA
jgi:septum site-determining protein MinC